MKTSAPGPGSDSAAVRVSFGAGHYLAAVAEHLLEADAAIWSIALTEPEDDPRGRELVGALYFGDELATRFGTVRRCVSLNWSETSGWCLRRSGDELRWAGAGLVPEPRQVAEFLERTQHEREGVGSYERPYYRAVGGDHGPLLCDLADYLPDPEGASDVRGPERFALARKAICLRRIVRDLALAAESRDQCLGLNVPPAVLDAVLRILEQIAPDLEVEPMSCLSVACDLIKDLRERARHPDGPWRGDSVGSTVRILGPKLDGPGPAWWDPGRDVAGHRSDLERAARTAAESPPAALSTLPARTA